MGAVIWHLYAQQWLVIYHYQRPIVISDMFSCMCSGMGLWQAVEQLPLDQQYVLYCLPVIGQQHVLMLQPAGEQVTAAKY